MLVFDIGRRESFTNLNNWIQQIKIYARSELSILLVGNKCDLEFREISEYEARIFAKKY